MIELPMGQALSPLLTNSDMITGIVYAHMTIEPVVIQKLDEKNTLLVLTESEDMQISTSSYNTVLVHRSSPYVNDLHLVKLSNQC